MPFIHIVGRKNSGKTTLIVELVRHLTHQGYRVGTVKHTHHLHELDTPGKDSHQHREAGAAAVGILSPMMNAIFWPNNANSDIGSKYEKFACLLQNCDVVLVEGHLHADAIKLEVWRADLGQPPYAVEVSGIRAIITDDAHSCDVPRLSRKDVPGLAAEVLRLARPAQ